MKGGMQLCPARLQHQPHGRSRMLDGYESRKRRGVESDEEPTDLLISQTASCLVVTFGKNSLLEKQTVTTLCCEHYVGFGNPLAVNG